MGINKLGHRKIILQQIGNNTTVVTKQIALNDIISHIDSSVKNAISQINPKQNPKQNPKPNPKQTLQTWLAKAKPTQTDHLRLKKKLFNASRDLETLENTLDGWLLCTESKQNETDICFQCMWCMVSGKKNCKLADIYGICCSKTDVYLYSVRFQKVKQSIWVHDTCPTHVEAICSIKRLPSLKQMIFKKRGRIFLRNLTSGGADRRCLRDMHCQIDNGTYLGEDGMQSTHQIPIFRDIMYAQCQQNSRDLLNEPYLFGGDTLFSSSLDCRSQTSLGLIVHHVWAMVRGKMTIVPLLFSQINSKDGHTKSGKDLAIQHSKSFEEVELNTSTGLICTCGDGEFIKKHLETHMNDLNNLMDDYTVEWCPIHQVLIINKASKVYVVGLFYQGYNMGVRSIQQKIRTQYQQTALKKLCAEKGIIFESTKLYPTTRFTKYEKDISESLNHTYPAIIPLLRQIDPKGAYLVCKSVAWITDNIFVIDWVTPMQIFEKIWEKDTEFPCMQIKAIFDWKISMESMKAEFDAVVEDHKYQISDKILPYLADAQQQLYKMEYLGVELIDSDYMDGDTLDFGAIVDESIAEELTTEMQDWYSKYQKASKSKFQICQCGAICDKNNEEHWIECSECFHLSCNKCTKKVKDVEKFRCNSCKKGERETADETNEASIFDKVIQTAENIIMTRSRTNALNQESIDNTSEDIAIKEQLSRGTELFVARSGRYSKYIELMLILFLDAEIGILKESRWKKFVPYYTQNIFNIKHIMVSVRKLCLANDYEQSRRYICEYQKKI
eukprot:469687_1